MKNKTIEMTPSSIEIVTPEHFVKVYLTERDNIKSVKIVPGRLGGDHFGRFIIERNRPVFIPSTNDLTLSR